MSLIEHTHMTAAVVLSHIARFHVISMRPRNTSHTHIHVAAAATGICLAVHVCLPMFASIAAALRA